MMGRLMYGLAATCGLRLGVCKNSTIETLERRDRATLESDLSAESSAGMATGGFVFRDRLNSNFDRVELLPY